MCSCSVVVITCALHAQGPQFDPGQEQAVFVSYLNTVTFPDIMLGSTARAAKSVGMWPINSNKNILEIHACSDPSRLFRNIVSTHCFNMKYSDLFFNGERRLT